MQPSLAVPVVLRVGKQMLHQRDQIQ
jgi:hypothetical protein